MASFLLERLVTGEMNCQEEAYLRDYSVCMVNDMHANMSALCDIVISKFFRCFQERDLSGNSRSSAPVFKLVTTCLAISLTGARIAGYSSVTSSANGSKQKVLCGTYVPPQTVTSAVASNEC